ncbi:efflux RND transporter periplasmic adaptor subunit [Carboxylicivirga marina]|uniref:efflux RND transporter periplasmic adaptor subunit n=1 Tax=Carboxylicivirga marina TaxID=2800988 RepID=UPI002591EC3C|nr:HlyD family efflux transporter periplasmic adaptor subunit [uncultured Carboxylicivirga sp.]
MNHYGYILYFVIGMLVSSCSNLKQDDGGHAHDDITIPYTAYSDKLEVFVDVQPLAVANNSQLIIHFTDLETFKPVLVDEVSVSLIVGGKGIRVKSKEASKSGVFKVIIQPSTAGVGRFEFELLHNNQKQKVTINNVKVYDDAHDAAHLGESLIPDSPDAVSFTKEQSWKVDFKTDKPEIAEFGSIIKVSARVNVSPAEQMIVAAKSSGFIQYSSGLLSIGQAVSNNEWLMTISGQGLTENNTIVRAQEAKVEYDIAKSDYLRDKRLHQQKIVSNRQLLVSKARFEKAESQWSNLQKTVSENGEKVVAKMPGFIHELLVDNGEYVNSGMPLLTIIKNDRLVLKGMVRPSLFSELKTLYDANIELNNGEVINLSDLNGRLVSIGQSSGTDNYLLPVTLEIDKHDDLVSGGFANVYLRTGSQKKSVIIPNSALVEIQGLFFTYIQLTPELFERRQVVPGPSDGVHTVVLSGLKANERIVSRGATFVRLAAVSNTVDPHAGHVH